jgi:hypothetical protein
LSGQEGKNFTLGHSQTRVNQPITDQVPMTEHLFSVFYLGWHSFWFMSVFVQLDTHDQTFSEKIIVLKFF